MHRGYELLAKITLVILQPRILPQKPITQRNISADFVARNRVEYPNHQGNVLRKPHVHEMDFDPTEVEDEQAENELDRVPPIAQVLQGLDRRLIVKRTDEAVSYDRSTDPKNFLFVSNIFAAVPFSALGA